MVTVSFDNAPDGILLIRKVCATNPSVTLQNAEFKVMYADGTLIGDSNGIYRSDENGEIRIPGLMSKCTGTDHTVQTHFTTGRRGDAELRAGERLVGGAVPRHLYDGPGW